MPSAVQFQMYLSKLQKMYLSEIAKCSPYTHCRPSNALRGAVPLLLPRSLLQKPFVQVAIMVFIIIIIVIKVTFWLLAQETLYAGTCHTMALVGMMMMN